MNFLFLIYHLTSQDHNSRRFDFSGTEKHLVCEMMLLVNDRSSIIITLKRSASLRNLDAIVIRYETFGALTGERECMHISCLIAQ